MATRTIARIVLEYDAGGAVRVLGRIDDAVLAGVARSFAFQWSKLHSAFTAGEQTDIDDAIAAIQADFEAAEPLGGASRIVGYALFYDGGDGRGGPAILTAGAYGRVTGTVAGVSRSANFDWRQALSAYTGPEQTLFATVAAFVLSYLQTDEPL